MECLRDYIGILGCDETPPPSGKYINMLPGISLESIEAVTDDEYETYLQVWNKVQTRALAKLQIDINEKFAKHYKIKQLRSSIDMLRRINLDVTNAAAAKKRGFSVELTKANNLFVASNLQLNYVESLSLYVIDKDVAPNPIVLSIIDLDSEEVLDTFSIASPTNGWNKVSVNKYYQNNRLAFTYDATSIASPEQKISTLIANGFYALVNAVYGGFCDPFLRGFESNADLTGQAFGSDTFGLTAVIGVHCKFDKIVCDNRESFAYPLWYLLGCEIMIEVLNSGRTNQFTSGIDRDKAEELYKDYYAEYDKSLSQVTESISLNGNDACLTCNEPIRYIESVM